MNTYKRGESFWLNVIVNDVRYRVPLNTKDKNKKSDLALAKLEELKKLRPDSAKRAKAYGAMTRIINAADPEHYVFPWQGGTGKVDATRPMAGWRSAWRTILKEAGVECRFHDLRCTADSNDRSRTAGPYNHGPGRPRLTRNAKALLSYSSASSERLRGRAAT